MDNIFYLLKEVIQAYFSISVDCRELKMVLAIQFKIKKLSSFNRTSVQNLQLLSSMAFSIPKDDLVEIIKTCQDRSYAQEVDLLKKHGSTTDWLIHGLKSDSHKGISNDEEDLIARREVFGSNTKEVTQPPGFFELLWQTLEDFTLRVLLVAAALSIILSVSTAPAHERSQAWIEGFAIFVAVGFVSVLTAATDYSKQRQFRVLNEVAEDKKRVTLKRDNITLELHQDNVLVGDIVDLVTGMEIPADGIVLEASDLTCDESAMTGQADPIKKLVLRDCVAKQDEVQANGEKNLADRHEIPTPVLMSGTKILSGEGKMVIIVVGKESCIGRVREKIEQEENQPTPLQSKLEKLAGDIGKFGLYSAIVIMVVLLIRFAVVKGTTKTWDTGADLGKLLNYLLIAITVVVLAIPEGLPLSVTLSLAFSVRRMLADQNLVRKMQACETMGGANNICSDKTGTLTLNKMSLSQVWNASTKVIDIHKQNFVENDLSLNAEFNELFKVATLVNSSAMLRPEEKGSSTEIAVLKFFEKMNSKYEDCRQKYEVKHKFPFSSTRKRMSVVVNYNDNATLFIKGASEIVLASCTQWFNSQNGQIEPISEEQQANIKNVINSMAENSLRTLCLGYKKLMAHDDLEVKDSKGVYECEKDNIILIAVIGVRDEPRKEVPGAIKQCHNAGITVRMVTGDNIVTAKAIAKECGIIVEGKDYLAMEGPEFNRIIGGVICSKCKTLVCPCPTTKKRAAEENVDLRVDTIANGEEFDKIKDRLLILARSRPEDKYALVTGLRERGNVVAVTGDGTNDAPALKKADVGFAMGIAGTEVAREAAAITLIDDNFSSIVKAVLWGRNIYDSIRKFIQFQLTVNLVAVLCTFVGAAVFESEILRPIQLLWLNLIMDTLASLALATEDPEESLLDRQPHSRDEYIISKTMLKHIIGQSIYQLILILALVFMGELIIPEYVDSYDTEHFATHPEYKWHNGVVGGTVRSGRPYFANGDMDYEAVFEHTGVYSRHFTFIFNTFVMLQVFNFVNCRKLHEEFNTFSGITKNPIFLVIVGSIIVLQLILVTFSGTAFGVYSNYGLTVQQWLLSIAIGSTVLIVNLLIKLLPCGKEDHIHESSGGIGIKEETQMRRPSVLSLKRIEERVERDLAKNNHPFDMV